MKIIVEMDFDFDGFENLEDEEKFSSIEAVLESGAESYCASISIQSITLKDGEDS